MRKYFDELYGNPSSQLYELGRKSKEAIEKAKYYLKNDSARKRIARKGQEFVRKYHTYERRVRENLLPFI